MKYDRCNQCGALIIWAVNASTLNKAPLDARPWDDYGNIMLGDGLTYQILEPEIARQALYRRFQLYTNHLGTCPARERERKVS